MSLRKAVGDVGQYRPSFFPGSLIMRRAKAAVPVLARVMWALPHGGGMGDMDY
jgi:hypothetical protein